MQNKAKIDASKIAQESIEDVYQEFETSKDGLTASEANKKLQEVGKNTIQRGQKEPQWKVFLKNFTSLMALLLWVSGFIAIFAQMVELGIAIWAVNIINGLFS